MSSVDHRDSLLRRHLFELRAPLRESLKGSLRVGRNMPDRPGLANHLQLENPGDHDDRLRTVPIFEHCELESFSTINEKTAAEPLLILHNPMAVAVLADAE
jgi:hypothetical protein